MDFVGLRTCEKEEIVDLDILYSIKAFVYDHRFRPKPSTEYKLSSSLGVILTDEDDFLNSSENFLTLPYDPYDKLMFMSNLYFSMRPRYINITNDTWCDYKRESFRHWLALRTQRIRFERNTMLRIFRRSRVYSGVSKLQESYSVILNQLLRNFTRLPPEVVQSPDLSAQFGLPLINASNVIDELENRWLLLMSWARLVNTELHPLVCNTQYGSGDQTRINNVYHKCFQLKSTSKMSLHPYLYKEQGKLQMVLKDLPTLKKYGEKVKTFLLNVLVFTQKAVSLVTSYLIDAQTRSGESSLMILSGRLQEEVIDANDKIKAFLFRRYLFSRFESNMCVNSIIQNVEPVIERYAKRKFPIAGSFGKKQEKQNRIFHRLQKFVLKLMENVSAAFIENMSLYYRLPLKNEHLKRLAKSILIHLSWISMNILLNSTDLTVCDSSIYQLQRFSNPLDITKVQNILSDSVIQNSIRNICLEIQRVQAYVFTLKPAGAQEVILPLSYIYQDFPDFLAIFPGSTRSCRNPLVDMEFHTDGKLKRFMIECVVCLFHNMPAMEELVHLAREYIGLPAVTEGAYPEESDFQFL